MKIYQAIARNVRDHGVEVMFGLIGDANLYMVDSFIRDCQGRYIAASHEARAMLMALGYAQRSGRIGVATITHGPALTNALTALVEGVKSGVSAVLLCGDTPVADRDHLQKIPQREFVASTGAGFEQLRSAATLTEDIATACRRARLEKRPIVLNVPVELQWDEAVNQPTAPLRLYDSRGLVPESAELDNAVGIIASARRPIVLAGRGAMEPETKAAIVRLAARIGAPVATTLRGKDLFRGEDHNLGIFGTLSAPLAVEIMTECDCVIAFGASLNRFTTAENKLLENKRVIHIDSDPAVLGRRGIPDAGLVGDAGLVADKLLYWLDEAEIPSSGYCSDELKHKLAAYRPSPRASRESVEGRVDIREALLFLNAAVPANRVFVTDGGRFLREAWQVFDVEHPSSFVYTVGYGSIGLGLGEAIGAAAAADAGQPTLLVSGDGGFMLGNLTEFNTAVRHGSDLIVVVCNDGGYGAEHIQFRSKNMDPSVSLLNWPDLAPVAIALGGEGITIRSADDFAAAAIAIRDRTKPLLIDVKIDPDSVPTIAH